MSTAARRAVRSASLLGATLALLVVAGCGGGKDGNGTTGGQETGGPSAQVGFYDWEPNVYGDPNRPIPGLFEAVTRASRAKPKAEPTDIPPGGPDAAALRRAGVNPSDKAAAQRYYDRKNDIAGAKYYLFGPDRGLIAGPAASCGDVLGRYGSNTGTSNPAEPKKGRSGVPKDSACRDELKKLETAGPPAGSQVKVVPRGIAVLAAERPPGRYFVLEDDSELTAADITDPKQAFDSLTHKPTVVMKLTPRGRAAFARVTKREAQRGAAATPRPGTPQGAALQHFAIAVNGRIVSLATIDYRQNPSGIDGRTGVQISGLSVAAARRLAAQLR